MKPKTIAAIIVIIGFVIFGSYSFMESNLEYVNVATAIKKDKKVQLTGSWNRDKPYAFDASSGKFSFFLVDEVGDECKVILDGAAPNNFELATSVVAKGRYTSEGYFHATEVLTKCPSKYEAEVDELKKSS